MKLSHAIKTTLIATAFLGTFSLAYAGDANISGNVTQNIELHDISADSTSGQSTLYVGSVTAKDNSSIDGDLRITVKADTVSVDTKSGQTKLSLGGVKMGESSNNWWY